VASALSRDHAWQLLNEYTKGDSLLKHALAVEAAVRGYARRFGEDPGAEAEWGGADLLELPQDAHISNVIASLREQAGALGLQGTL